ncbi:MAG: HAD family hydrolase [Ignavibacteriae bacterium]|nr:MAG: HAD family hydrolase [Ignavibacteriota bacterium]
MSSKYKSILFDLDGTITDPCEGITNAYMYAVEKLNLKEDSPALIRNYIGSPLHSYFELRHGFKSHDELNSGVSFYREYYGDKGMFECRIYDGMPELLNLLNTNGSYVYLVTSKPSFYAEKILKHFGLLKYFKAIIGSDMTAYNKSKVELIQNLFDEHTIEPNSAVMIGDRKYDVLGAKHHGIASIGVTYGYGSAAEIKEAEPDYIAGNVDELKVILITSS